MPVDGYGYANFAHGIRTFQIKNGLQLFFPFAGRLDLAVIREAPAPEWKGEGLPPAGTVCERRTMPEGDGRYEQVRIIARTSKGFPVWENTDAMFAGISKFPHLVGGFPEFRPIRTPEQMAAEQRDRATATWLETVAEDYGQETADQCELILTGAGYRKQVAP
ncbi:hypothetical protein B7H19_11330 [Pseudomonas putida]|nr:hypothetical protein B7H19_11330 [Pseudomonas putida]